MIYGISLIVLGILASPSILLSKKPDAKELLDKITPYQSWIGLVFCFWGIWGMISAVLNLGWLASAPIWWITFALGSVLEAALGFLLGYSLLVKYVLSKNEEAKKKGDELLAKLQPIQGKIGLLGVCLGIWWTVASLIFM